jgi:hypothetical protein
VRRLTKREVRLIIVLVVVAVLALIGIAFMPPTPPNPEEAHAYYVNLFERAQVMTIRPTSGGEPVHVTRDAGNGLFHQLALGARNGSIAGAPSAMAPAYLLDVTLSDGKTVEGVRVSYHLEAPDQPMRGKLWLFPGSTEGPFLNEPMSEPPLVAAIDEYLESLEEQPSDSTEEPAAQETG